MTALAFLFPGQGAQYVGMGKSFYDAFPTAREIFSMADDILHLHLSKIIFDGPERILTETRIAQPAIFVTSMAILKTLQQHYALTKPICTAGLSLGEYSALVAAEIIPLEEALQAVHTRASLMHEACEHNEGVMVAVIGLSDEDIIRMVKELRMPQEIWCANFNSPGQVVLSGTKRGVDAASQAAKARGAKRILPLNVHGAFHSGLMKSAQEGLIPIINTLTITPTDIRVAMNATGTFATSETTIRHNLISQVTSGVLWHTCIHTCESCSPDFFLEIGCGKTLTGLNKRIATPIPTYTIETVDDCKKLERIFS